jgi:hypothetical protein
MNGLDAIAASIRNTLAKKQRDVLEVLEEARTGAQATAAFRAEQEIGRTMRPVASSNPGGARDSASPSPAGTKGNDR